MKISCHIIDSLPITIPPSEEFVSEKINARLKNLKLADPTFHEGGTVDMILGASIFWPALLQNQISADSYFPTLQETIFGWIVGGCCTENLEVSPIVPTLTFTAFEKQSVIDANLQKFWEIEDGDFQESRSEVSSCEKIFCETLRDAEDGKFIVQLPLKEHPIVLGNSKSIALKKLFDLERKLDQNEKFRTLYSDFMREYISLNHMSLVPEGEEDTNPAYYIPHLGVLREGSLTTKLRVVFNASSKTSPNNKSLNDILHVGPTIQDTLFEILLRFREYPVALTADITKMYRQIWIDEAQRDLQRILWREKRSDPVKIYRLNTVTYGTGPAPFLAIRSLNEAALQQKHRYAAASKSILSSFYVDDYLGGAETIKEAIQLKNDVEEILLRRGFPLRKWASNEKNVFQNTSNRTEPFYFNEETDVKVLGIGWIPKTDQFFFKTVNSPTPKNGYSKRTILSETSKLFDPLGLVSPVVIRAKFIMQKVWLQKLKWDEKAPTEIQSEWETLRSDFQELQNLKISRHLLIFRNDETITFHGFSDASMKGFGACVYVSVTNKSKRVTKLVCAKSRVAPLRTKQTLPRLELAATLLLSKLMVKVTSALQIEPASTFMWSDSAIALHWISNAPNKWQAFVANRVDKIQSLTETLKATWRHVSTKNNPADLITRGASAKHLSNSSLWWQGPEYLNSRENMWPKTNVELPSLLDVPEIRKEIKIMFGAIVQTSSDLHYLLHRFSSLNKILRIIGFMFRFVHNIRARLANKPSEIKSGNISSREMDGATKICVKIIQQESFPEEIAHLSRKDGILQSSSSIKTLHPFLDGEKLLRVGGRLQNSTLSYEEKHPLLLPTKHRFTELLFWQEHRRLMHAPPQMLLSMIRQRFWPLNGPISAKKLVYSCLKCRRAQPKPCAQLMAPLPASRVTVNAPFQIIGIDFTAPLLVRTSNRKNAHKKKVYVALFICFVSKAVHLEIIESLTTQEFLQTLERFSARRGLPTAIFSDNAKTFVGAKSELITLFKDPKVQEYLSQNGIDWNFNPPNSPHHGGLWESAIRSFKSTLQKVNRSRVFQAHELNNLVVKIEGALNSRPLTPLSSSPDDYEALTPGHFLIGRAIMSFPTKFDSHKFKSSNVLKTYKSFQQDLSHFWRRWSREYLQSLQYCAKWHTSNRHIQVGSLVVVKNRNSPALYWNLGRIIKTYPGTDGHVRVAKVKTPTSVLIRAVTELCPLPVLIK